MSKILLITSSPRLESHSTKVARTLVERLISRLPNSTVTVRDLTREPLPHIDDSFATGRDLPIDKRSPAQRDVLELSDKLLEELFAADTIVIAAGMINFGIPSNLKAYIDYIARPGVAFRYTEKGPEGLIKGKKVYLVLARGGVYSEGPMQQFNFQDTYLRAALSLMGVTDIEVITIEGVAFGPDAADRAVRGALDKVSAIAA
ncbi:MAG TPA: FMN-dependent NADH-azoreductase [Caulobacteraceae bacterium]|jgi:FMN-dependent NADH-azoreductase